MSQDMCQERQTKEWTRGRGVATPLRRQSRNVKRVGVLPIRMIKSNVSSVSWPFVREKRFLSDEGPTLETLDFIIRIGSTPTFLYFDL